MMISVIRARSVNVLKHIEPILVFQDQRLRLPFIEGIAQQLTNSPDSILLLVAMDGSDLRASLIAHNPGPSLPYIFVSQLWSHPDNPPDWYKPFFARLILWTTANDKTYIRGETLRDTDAIYRRFGFEPFAQIVSFDLVKTGIYQRLTSHPEEFLKWVQT